MNEMMFYVIMALIGAILLFLIERFSNKRPQSSPMKPTRTYKEISDDFSFYVKRFIIIQVRDRIMVSRRANDGGPLAFGEMISKSEKFHQGLVSQIIASMGISYKLEIGQYMDTNKDSFFMWVSDIVEAVSIELYMAYKKCKEISKNNEGGEKEHFTMQLFSDFLQKETSAAYNIINRNYVHPNGDIRLVSADKNTHFM
jgi:hypothetical protein